MNPTPHSSAEKNKGSGSHCPLCKKATVHAFRPFCSARCKQVDLGKWFTEQYVIPGESLAESFDPLAEYNPEDASKTDKDTLA
jgi:endogenous inhibitor of DNA gyrase (YacG/DUF329 family)